MHWLNDDLVRHTFEWLQRSDVFVFLVVCTRFARLAHALLKPHIERVVSLFPCIVIGALPPKCFWNMEEIAFVQRWLGSTGYIDGARASELPHDFSYGVDVYGRSFVAIKKRSDVVVLFQRYSNTRTTWVFGSLRVPCGGKRLDDTTALALREWVDDEPHTRRDPWLDSPCKNSSSVPVSPFVSCLFARSSPCPLVRFSICPIVVGAKKPPQSNLQGVSRLTQDIMARTKKAKTVRTQPTVCANDAKPVNEMTMDMEPETLKGFGSASACGDAMEVEQRGRRTGCVRRGQTPRNKWYKRLHDVLQGVSFVRPPDNPRSR